MIYSPNALSYSTPEDKLRAHTDEFRKDIIKVMDNIHIAVGYGAANVILIEAENSCILIDTLESTSGAKVLNSMLKLISKKPIKTIIYTHSHQDHVGGAAVFAEGNNPEVISRFPFGGLLGGPAELASIFKKRASRQFGWNLSSEERLNVGIGTGDRSLVGLGAGFVQPTRQFADEQMRLTIDGVELELFAAPGETDDQLFVWLPKQKVLISADNYYKSFPNLYAIRGTAYRDIAVWVKSLDLMISKNAEYLLPGHSRPIFGQHLIQEVLTDYRDAIDYILKETLKGINQGFSPDELVLQVKLPPHLAQKPYLQEFYGTVPWTVRAIFTGYLGWFDGNPSTLFSLKPQEYAEQMAELAGGFENLHSQAQKALEDKRYQWAMQLADCLLLLDGYVQAGKDIKIAACRSLACLQISANARNYYFACAQELEK